MTSFWNKALNSIYSGDNASYVNGPLIVSKSCVPIATSVLFLHIYPCNLSCKSIKLANLSSSNVMFLRIAQTMYYLICLVIGLTIILFISLLLLQTYLGLSPMPIYDAIASERPSADSKSYRFAGSSKLNLDASYGSISNSNPKSNAMFSKVFSSNSFPNNLKK